MDVVAWEWQQGRHKDIAVLKTMKQVIAAALLPETGPHVQYIWAVRPKNPHLQSVLYIVPHTCAHARMGRGYGICGCRPRTTGWRIYEPAESGKRGLTPMPGTSDDLKAAYRRFQIRSAGGASIASRVRPRWPANHTGAQEKSTVPWSASD